jgi:multiple sugar transport system permease protein
LAYIPLLRYTLNTVFVAVSGTFATVLSCTLVAYGLGVVRWRGANALFLVMLATVMLPPQVTTIPVFLVFKKLGWIGTFRPLVIPAFFASAFFVFLLRQFFKTIPRDLLDAARIDGCSHFEVYWRIVLRLSRPALAVVIFFTFTGYWNDFMGPLIYLNDDSYYTLSLGLQQFVAQHTAKWELLMAASTMMILPVIALFFFLQRSFVEGINLTGLKG